ncbi:MAG: adenylate kinase [Bacteroidales bacterium]|nr:adenylate kinase [Bacteroidales bacterium]HOY38046.1 adenylate kinase [Bacteroidales bacterium]HQP03212.1 adenylate kinase [Bacteroidales bacterium]
MLNIAIFGPPGAGKGTQAQMLVKKYHLEYISTGDILRKEIANKTPLGLEAQQIIEKGLLVSDDVMARIIEAFIAKNIHCEGMLFDGYPRTSAQATILENLLQKNKMKLAGIIGLEVEQQILIERMLKRAEIEKRSDDTPEAIEKRLQEYHNKTFPVIDFYKIKHLYYPVDGMGTVDEVHLRIVNSIEMMQ